LYLSLDSIFLNSSAQAAWYTTGGTWTNRKPITIDHNKVSGASSLTNFSVLVSVTDPDLRHTSLGGKVGKTDGTDILFTSADGSTKLDHEIEKYASTTGELIAWVEIPSLSSSLDTTLYMYFGNAASSDQSNPTGTWNSNYISVWHIGENPASNGTTINDSTSNNLDASLTTDDGSSNKSTTGKIGQGIALDNFGDYVTKADDSLLSFTNGSGTDTAYSIGGWFYLNDITETAGLMSKWIDCTDDEWVFYIASGNLAIENYDAGGGCASVIGRSVALDSGSHQSRWLHIIATYNGSENQSGLKIYINGTQVDTTNTAGSTISGMSNTTAPVRVGDYGGAANNLNGSVDDIKILSTELSADWIKTEYNNQSSPNTFYSYGNLMSQSKQDLSNNPASVIKIRGGIGSGGGLGTITPGTGTTIYDFTPGTDNISVNVAAGSDRVLLATLSCQLCNVTAVSYNGSSMTQLWNLLDGSSIERSTAWILVNPSTGTNNLTVTWTAASDGPLYGFAQPWYGVSQTGGEGGSWRAPTTASSGGSGTASVTVSNSQNGDMVVDGVAVYNQDITADGSQTVQFNSAAPFASLRHGTSNKSVTGSTSMSWTMSSTAWAMGAVPLIPNVSAGSAGGGKVNIRGGKGLGAASSTAPTLISAQSSNYADTSNTETTSSISWQAGDLIVVVGSTEGGSIQLNTPTATGLSFSLVTSINVGDSNDTVNYLWQATAGSSGSSAVSATRNDSFTGSRGITAFVYRGSDGIGNTNTLDNSTAKTISLTRNYPSSAVILTMADWNAVNDTTVNPSPSGGTQRVATFHSGHDTTFVFDWPDRGVAGTASYGITNHTGTVDMSGIVVEIRGSTAYGQGTPGSVKFR
jgi:hypothetical protein